MYLLLFLSAFLASTILPLPSEVPLALVVRDTGERVWPVLVATAGNYLGACTTYLLARIAADRFAPAATPRWQRAAEAIGRYGPPALLFSWLPAIGDVLVAVAGAARMPVLRFSVWTALGKAGRYAVVAWAAAP